MNDSTPWFGRQLPTPDAPLRLFCLPYAGASASVYRLWSEFISPEIQVCPLELPGHGSRLREPLITSMADLVDELTEALSPHVERPYALLGHSMGASIAFHLASSLEQSGAAMPQHVVVMGCRPPHLPSPRPGLYRLPDSDLIAQLRSVGGTPDEILNHPDMMKLLLPILRADFELFETNPWTSPRPLRCSLSAFAGHEDTEVSFDQMKQWRRYTESDFRIRSYPGNHFFPWTCLDDLIGDIETDLDAA